MIHFSCPSCGTAASAPVEFAGRNTKCRGCGNIVTVPPAPPGQGKAPAQEKTTLGRMIAHTPTSLTPADPAAPPPPKSPAGPRKTVAAAPRTARTRLRQPRGSSALTRVAVFGSVAVVVLITASVFAGGLYFYLSTKSKPHDADTQLADATNPPTDSTNPPVPPNPEVQPQKKPDLQPVHDPVQFEKPAKKEPPKPEEIPTLVAALKSQVVRERLDAVEALGLLGETAKPAVAPLCDLLATDASPATRRAVLTALEKIDPDVHKSMAALADDPDAEANAAAALRLGKLGKQGRWAAPMLLAHLRDLPTRFNAQGNREGTVVQLTAADLHALIAIAPDDAAVQKALFDSTQSKVKFLDDVNGSVASVAVSVLKDLLDQNPDEVKTLLPDLIAAVPKITDDTAHGQALKLLGKIGEGNAELRPQVAAALLARLKDGDYRTIPLLPKCGRDAKDALPVLKELKSSTDPKVSAAALAAATQIEETLAKNDPPKKDPPDKETKPQPKPDELTADLKPLVDKLRTGSAEERIKAAQDLATLGDKAKPATRALCDACLYPSDKPARAALTALEKVNPDLQKAVFILLVDDKADNHSQALTTIADLGKDGKPALPILIHEIRTCQELLTKPGARWGTETLTKVTRETMQTMVKICPDDPQTPKMMLDLTTFTLPQGFLFRVQTADGFAFTRVPLQKTALQLLGELADTQPDHRKAMVAPLTTLFKKEVQLAGAPAPMPGLVGQVFTPDAITDITNVLLKCGPDAKTPLTKDVLPGLKELQFNKSEAVRKCADDLRTKVEERIKEKDAPK